MKIKKALYMFAFGNEEKIYIGIYILDILLISFMCVCFF